MVFFKQLYYFLVLILHYKLCMGYLEYDNWVNIALSHAIDHKNPNSFAYRGNITISSLEIGLAKTNQEVLTAIQIQNLEDLARANQMYRLKAEVYYADGKRQQFLSSTKACNLIMSNLNDILWISIDHNGYINAATVLTSRSDVCGCILFQSFCWCSYLERLIRIIRNKLNLRKFTNKIKNTHS
ncbi:uncharacterized protein LOC105219893 isoform X3 [Zeugodacus cucurbitae]|uniref:uncharacterized protein LOC105219893 isoform X3 n=1 Tax=Zeugodacus cucurbitae TaxID=28588 RepID=UPI0023D90E41|nr:uncharacterized protein LOC105219893 isoform X3 [Zeugodacus cucurbitae]